MDQVSLGVQLVPQTHDGTCWAASMAMVYNFANGASYTDDDIVQQAGVNTDGKTWSEVTQFAGQFGLQNLAPADWMPDGWAQELQAHGPIWTPEPGNAYHIVVVGGIQGDGTPEGSTFAIYDPWPPNGGNVETPSFTSFMQQYDLGEGYGAQLLVGR